MSSSLHQGERCSCTKWIYNVHGYTWQALLLCVFNFKHGKSELFVKLWMGVDSSHFRRWALLVSYRHAHRYILYRGWGNRHGTHGKRCCVFLIFLAWYIRIHWQTVGRHGHQPRSKVECCSSKRMYSDTLRIWGSRRDAHANLLCVLFRHRIADTHWQTVLLVSRHTWGGKSLVVSVSL